MSKIFEAFQEEKQKELEFSEREREHLDRVIKPTYVQNISKPERYNQDPNPLERYN